MDFDGKKVLVTGSSRGIGYAAAAAFIEHGALVCINGRTADSVSTATAELNRGGRAISAVGNVATAAGCESIVDAAVEGLGGLDVLVNAAGVWAPKSIEDSDEAFWDHVLDTNLKGTFLCARAALAVLRAHRGNIVNIASDVGLKGSKNDVVYSASKAAVVNMTRSMALELAPEVRVNCVCPGFVDTDMVRRDFIALAIDPERAEREANAYAPLGRMGRPREIAGAILYLASAQADYITGAALQIDGGSTAG